MNKVKKVKKPSLQVPAGDGNHRPQSPQARAITTDWHRSGLGNKEKALEVLDQVLDQD